jgi:hypothetical protein
MFVKPNVAEVGSHTFPPIAVNNKKAELFDDNSAPFLLLSGYCLLATDC